MFQHLLRLESMVIIGFQYSYHHAQFSRNQLFKLMYLVNASLPSNWLAIGLCLCTIWYCLVFGRVPHTPKNK